MRKCPSFLQEKLGSLHHYLKRQVSWKTNANLSERLPFIYLIMYINLVFATNVRTPLEVSSFFVTSFLALYG